MCCSPSVWHSNKSVPCHQRAIEPSSYAMVKNIHGGSEKRNLGRQYGWCAGWIAYISIRLWQCPGKSKLLKYPLGVYLPHCTFIDHGNTHWSGTHFEMSSATYTPALLWGVSVWFLSRARLLLQRFSPWDRTVAWRLVIYSSSISLQPDGFKNRLFRWHATLSGSSTLIWCGCCRDFSMGRYSAWQRGKSGNPSLFMRYRCMSETSSLLRDPIHPRGWRPVPP